MNRIPFFLLFLFALAACNLPLTQLPPTAAPQPSETTTATVAAYQPCYYVWAYQELPEITDELQAAIQKILPNAEARASAYGENCIAEDGSATFGAMETDFYICIPVEDLKDEAALGDIIVQVLTVVDQFPRPRVPGGKDGFVEFTFLGRDDQRVLRVPIPLGIQFRKDGLHGEELLKAIENQ